MESGPGAEDGEHFRRTAVISEGSSGGQFKWGLRMEGNEEGGEEGKKCPRRAELIFSGVSASGILGNLVGDFPRANFFAVHRDWGVARDRNEDQCAFFAFLMALKYPTLESRATSWSPRRPDFLALRAAPWYSFRSVVRRGDHQGFERADGLLWGVLT